MHGRFDKSNQIDAGRRAAGGSIVLALEDESEPETLLPLGDFDDEGLRGFRIGKIIEISYREYLDNI